MMDWDRLPELIARYETAGPRYTSYPTAPVWSEGVGPASYREALSVTGQNAVSLYIHVPFCRALCHYCACNKVITQNPELPIAYLATLAQEIEATSQALSGAPRAAHIHLGGGTPTHLEPDQLRSLMDMLTRAFPLEEGAELSIEVDPRVTTSEHMDALEDCGFNRISLGVQDFDDRVQQAVRRIQPVSQVAALVDRARTSGFVGVNFDLIYGLPYQTEKSFNETIDRVLELEPDRVALYSYAHVTWVAKQQRGFERGDLPGAGLKLKIMILAIRRFLEAGYIHIGMDHFARPGDELARAHAAGKLHRNFMGYTTRASNDLLAFGPSGIGELTSGFFQSQRTLKDWRKSVAEQGLATHRGHHLSEEDRRRSWAIRQIMCRDAISAEDYRAEFDGDFGEHFAAELQALDPMVADEIVEWKPNAGAGSFAVTPIGRLFVRNIAMVFDAYLPEQLREGRRLFSKTI